MKIKQKRYYIDKSESDKILFVTSGRRNKFVRDVELYNTVEVDVNTIGFESNKFQDDHSLSGYNACFLEDRDLVEYGLDTKYQFFWRKCVDNEDYHNYNTLFRMLSDQLN